MHMIIDWNAMKIDPFLNDRLLHLVIQRFHFSNSNWTQVINYSLSKNKLVKTTKWFLASFSSSRDFPRKKNSEDKRSPDTFFEQFATIFIGWIALSRGVEAGGKPCFWVKVKVETTYNLFWNDDSYSAVLSANSASKLCRTFQLFCFDCHSQSMT